jgi:UDP-glucose 4-epimerase
MLNLVTGGAGFIGSHLTERLLQLGQQVIVIDDLSTGREANLQAVRGSARLELIAADMAADRRLESLLPRVDRVFHLAAAVGVALVAKQPIEAIERNVYPTQLLFEQLRAEQRRGHSIACFLASTSEVYGKNPKSAWREDDELVFGATTKPRWSYGVSKAIDEFLALGCHRQYQLPVVVGRFFNVVGPRQSPAYGMVLPRLVSAALRGEPMIVHDDGQQQRCFAHVQDVVTAVLALMETPAAIGQVVNIGSDQPITILDLAERVRQRVNPAAVIEFQSYQQAFDADFEDVRRRVPVLDRLHGLIAHRPQHSLDQIIDDLAAQMRQAASPSP